MFKPLNQPGRTGFPGSGRMAPYLSSLKAAYPKMLICDDIGRAKLFKPDEIAIVFGDAAMNARLLEIRRIRTEGAEKAEISVAWRGFIGMVDEWMGRAAPDYERRKVYATVLFEYGTATHDMATF